MARVQYSAVQYSTEKTGRVKERKSSAVLLSTVPVKNYVYGLGIVYMLSQSMHSTAKHSDTGIFLTMACFHSALQCKTKLFFVLLFN